MSDPWVSVILPVRNGANYLRNALDSVVVQQDEGLEVVAIDDGSSDQTIDILEEYTDRLPLTILRRQLSNWAAATNVGLAEARGRYISILHSDDEWIPGRLQMLREHVESHGDVSLVVHPSRYIDGRGRHLGTLRCPLPAGELESGVVQRALLVQNFVAPPAHLFPREAASRLGGMDVGLWYAPDWDLWLKLAGLGKTLHVPLSLTRYRLHLGSLTSTRTGDLKDFRFQLETVLHRHLSRSDLLEREFGDTESQARFSLELNLALVSVSHGHTPDVRALWEQLRSLRPAGFRSYLHTSRLSERMVSRLRAGLVLSGRR